jgi:hypothetical protein
MRRILLFFFLFSFLFTSFSQDINNEMPFSWSQDLRNEITPVELPPLNLDDIIAEDLINDLDKTIPWRYGVSRSLVLDFEKDGLWTTLPNGDRIWQVGIKSPNAINISVNFNDFYLPEGARLHIYNNDRTDISKTYSSAQNRDNKILGSWYVEGDFIWVEYYERANTPELLNLEIGSIIHGYRMEKVNDLINNRGMGDSGECNYDVNCSIGNDFDLKKDLVKKAVAILNLGNGFLCSASLINNTQSDKIPYLLTANHCLEYSDPSFWSVRFNWMSPNPICGSGDESSDIQTNFTMSGAELKANNSASDFALVELHNEIPLSWDVAFAGWDNTDDLPLYEIGIHHPNGDIMKICRDDSGAVRENANGTDVWLIGGTSVGTGDGWEIGTTESGSSGSPLFNEDGRIIGQLYAGQSFCNGFENNNDYDIYGRFGTSWNYGDTPETRLMDWLDPNGTGQTTTESIQNILSNQDFELTGSLDIFPNPASTFITIINSRYPKLAFSMYNVVGQKLLSGSLSNTNNEINVENLEKGIYFLYLLDRESNADMTKKIIID